MTCCEEAMAIVERSEAKQSKAKQSKAKQSKAKPQPYEAGRATEDA